MQTPAERLTYVRKLRGFSGSRKAAARFGWNENTYKAHETGANGFGAEQAIDYAKAFAVTAGWLLMGEGDAPRPEANARDPRPIEPDYSGETLPVFGRAVGGPDGRFELNGEVIDRVAAPPGLRGARGAYAIYVDGVSMEPRYHEGEAVYVHPGKPVRQGDYVVIQIKPDHDGAPVEGLIKRLVSRSPVKLVAEQFNPPMKLEFHADEVLAVHRIVLGGEG